MYFEEKTAFIFIVINKNLPQKLPLGNINGPPLLSYYVEHYATNLKPTTTHTVQINGCLSKQLKLIFPIYDENEFIPTARSVLFNKSL